MSRYLLDTDTLTLLEHRHPRVLAQVSSQASGTVNLACITVQEQMEGWLGLLNRARSPVQIASAYEGLVLRLMPAWNQFAVLAFSIPAIQRFEHIRALRLNVGSMDLRIAAVALENNLIVVTRNRRDFIRVPGLTCVDWSI